MSRKRAAESQIQVPEPKSKKPSNDESKLLTLNQLLQIQKTQATTHPEALQNLLRGLGDAIVIQPATAVPAEYKPWTQVVEEDPTFREMANAVGIALEPDRWAPPPPTQHAFTNFAVYMLPPCVDMLFVKGDEYIEKLKAYTAAKQQGNKTVEDAARTALKQATGTFSTTVKQTLEGWVKEAFGSLGFPAKPGLTAAGYQDSNLHVILMPEFGFNGRVDNSNTCYDALHPLPDQVERDLCKYIHDLLIKDYGHLRVICAFSMATFSDLDLVYEESMAKKIASANRITIVTSTAMPPRQVTKYSPSGIDGWKNDLASGLTFHDFNTTVREADDPYGIARMAETRFNLACFGEKERAIAFGTCLDALIDKSHGDVNLVVMLGCGCPIGEMKDQAHPFILNDIYGWKTDYDRTRSLNYYVVDPNAFNAVGLYEHFTARPPKMPATVKDVKSLGIQYKIPGADKWTSSSACYYHADLVKTKDFIRGGVATGKIAHLEPIPFPAKNDTSVFKFN